MKRWAVAVYVEYDPGWFKSIRGCLQVFVLNAPDRESAKATAYSEVNVDGEIQRGSIMITSTEVLP